MLLVVGTTSTPRASVAASLRLDTTLAGADHDAILDGFPGLATLDGAGDLPGNALAVSLKDGVTEERAILELPLAPLTAAEVGADRIASATLYFNVDDVLTTFGPGTDFDGTAAERISVATYAGDGIVDLPDFAQGVAAGSVTTGPQGSISDASLRIGGPITFAVDITASVKQLVSAGATHVGIVLSTDDSPTGTSIDDRGDGGTGAPGAAGATMPYLIVLTIDATPTPAPTPTTKATASPTPTPAASATAPGATPSPLRTSSPGTSPSPSVTGTPAPTVSGSPTSPPTPAATTPTPSPSLPTPQASATPVPTATSTTTPATPTPHGSTTPAATSTPTTVPTAANTPIATATPIASTTATASPDRRPTPTPRPILTASPRPTRSPGEATPSPTGGALPGTHRPDASGDQLVFLYDARDGFTTFLNLHNLGDDGVRLRIALCDAALEPQLEREAVLAPGATWTLDITALRAEGLGAIAGAAFASAIDEAGGARVSRALAGNFTIANLATGSAWGSAAVARRAVAVAGDAGSVPPRGATIDGRAIRLQGIAPDQLDLAVFYDPATLAPAASGGNQLVLLSFDDDGSDPIAARTLWQVDARRADGERLPTSTIAGSGVTTTDLVTLLGRAAEGASGSIHFGTTDGAGNRLIFFVQAIGTFATGYALPPVTP